MASKDKFYLLIMATVLLLMLLLLFYSGNDDSKKTAGPILDTAFVGKLVQVPTYDTLIQQYNDGPPWDLKHKTDFYLPNFTKINAGGATTELTKDQADYYTKYLNSFYAKKMSDWVEKNVPESYDPGKFRAIATEMEDLLSNSGGKISPTSIADCRKSIGLIDNLNSYLNKFTFLFKELSEVDNREEYNSFYDDTYIPLVEEKLGLNILLYRNPEVISKCNKATIQAKAKALSLP